MNCVLTWDVNMYFVVNYRMRGREKDTDRKNCRNSTQHSKKKPRNAPFPDIKSKNTLIIK